MNRTQASVAGLELGEDEGALGGKTQRGRESKGLIMEGFLGHSKEPPIYEIQRSSQITSAQHLGRMHSSSLRDAIMSGI